MNQPLVLLDAASLYFRAFYALPDSLRSPDGIPINAIRGFLDMVAKIIIERNARRLVACLDADWRPAFRVAALPSYKAHRVADKASQTEQVPDILTPQIPIILDFLAAAGIATAQAAGYEADDVIGTLATLETIDPVEVITGDRDLFQLVRDDPTPLRVIYVGRGWNKAEILGPAELAAKYDLPVAQAGAAYAGMATLRGDPSDGLPGVAGIGEKTAAQLMRDCGSLDALLAALNDPRDIRLSPRIREKLSAASQYLTLAPTVVSVATAAPVELDRSDVLKPIIDLDPVIELGKRWGVTTATNRLINALANNH